MGAGSAKGANVNEEEDADNENDRFSVISEGSPEMEPKIPKSSISINTASNKVQAKIEALAADSDEENSEETKVTVEGEKKEDEKKRGLFGFSRRKEDDEKPHIFVHDSSTDLKRNSKKENSKGFKFFNFRKESSKKSEKDEKLDQEIKDLQRTFDSLGIVGKSVWDEGHSTGEKAKKSQSADDIRDLEPMRNRLNQKRRFSRPANAGTSIRRVGDGLTTSSGGTRRTFKYSWETENRVASPVRSEEWNYEEVAIVGFDLDKFKQANTELPDSYLTDNLSDKMKNSSGSGSPPSSPSGMKSPLMYDQTEQKILATIERDFI